jgi:hypothetical protein
LIFLLHKIHYNTYSHGDPSTEVVAERHQLLQKVQELFFSQATPEVKTKYLESLGMLEAKQQNSTDYVARHPQEVLSDLEPL